MRPLFLFSSPVNGNCVLGEFLLELLIVSVKGHLQSTEFTLYLSGFPCRTSHCPPFKPVIEVMLFLAVFIFVFGMYLASLCVLQMLLLLFIMFVLSKILHIQ